MRRGMQYPGSRTARNARAYGIPYFRDTRGRWPRAACRHPGRTDYLCPPCLRHVCLPLHRPSARCDVRQSGPCPGGASPRDPDTSSLSPSAFALPFPDWAFPRTCSAKDVPVTGRRLPAMLPVDHRASSRVGLKGVQGEGQPPSREVLGVGDALYRISGNFYNGITYSCNRNRVTVAH